MKAKLAKRKTGFCMRMKESWKEMKLWDAEELNKLDWVISALILIFLFFTCAYGDLMLTGNRSFLMYEPGRGVKENLKPCVYKLWEHLMSATAYFL